MGFKCRFFLINVLIWSIAMLGIQIRKFLKSELNGLLKNIQNFNHRCNRSQNITVNKAGTVFGTPCKINKTVKMNYKNYPNFIQENWSCQEHVLWCFGNAELRVGFEINSDDDLH